MKQICQVSIFSYLDTEIRQAGDLEFGYYLVHYEQMRYCL